MMEIHNDHSVVAFFEDGEQGPVMEYLGQSLRRQRWRLLFLAHYQTLFVLRRVLLPLVLALHLSRPSIEIDLSHMRSCFDVIDALHFCHSWIYIQATLGSLYVN